jgi:hypothetical protein
MHDIARFVVIFRFYTLHVIRALFELLKHLMLENVCKKVESCLFGRYYLK